jgi:hypothetical protein
MEEGAGYPIQGDGCGPEAGRETEAPAPPARSDKERLTDHHACDLRHPFSGAQIRRPASIIWLTFMADRPASASTVSSTKTR